MYHKQLYEKDNPKSNSSFEMCSGSDNGSLKQGLRPNRNCCILNVWMCIAGKLAHHSD